MATRAARGVRGRVNRTNRIFRQEWLRRGVQLLSLAAFVSLVVIAPWLNMGWLPAQLFSRLDPLVGLTIVIASRALIMYAVLGLITVALTLLFGRAWCGWLCPLGTLLDFVPAAPRERARRVPGWWRWGKYMTFAIVLGAAIFGTLVPMVLDPITIAMRPLQELVMPYLGSDAVGISVGSYLSRDAVRFVAWLALVPLAIVLSLNALARRFWCRSLCPLGGMLATLSNVSLVRRVVDTEACTRCATCYKECPTGAIVPKKEFASSAGECIDCLHCVDVCPENAISFKPAGRLTPVYEPERRETVATLGATGLSVAGVLVLPRVTPGREILRPPSTTEARLAERCVRCGACYAACPTGALRPSTDLLSQAGLWTPMLDERPAHCSLNCNLCARVCPTDALHTPTEDEALLLGLGAVAKVDRTTCAAWSRGHACLKCARVCPIVGTIGSERVVVQTRFGPKTVDAPVIREETCIACGLCSQACPEMPPAIRLSY